MKKLSLNYVPLVAIAMISMALMANDIYIPGVVEMSIDLKVSENLAGLTIVLYFIFYSFGQIVIGPLSDIHGRWKTLICFQVVFFLSTAGCAVAANFSSLLALRILQAIGACSGPVIGRAMMCDVCSKDKFTKMMSVTAIVKAVVPALSPIIGSFLLALAGWQSGFFLTAIVAGTVLIILYVKLPETLPDKTSDNPNLKSVIVSYVEMLKNRVFMRYTICASIIGGGFFVIMVLAPFACMREYGLSPQVFSLIYGLHVVFFIFGAVLLNIIKKMKDEMPYVEVIIFFGIILSAISIWLFFRPSIYLLSLNTMIFTMMMGTLVPSLTSEAIVNFSRRAGAASALNGFLFYFIGSAFGMVFSIIPEDLMSRSNLLALSTVGLSILAMTAFIMLSPKPIMKVSEEYELNVAISADE